MEMRNQGAEMFFCPKVGVVLLLQRSAIELCAYPRVLAGLEVSSALCLSRKIPCYQCECSFGFNSSLEEVS